VCPGGLAAALFLLVFFSQLSFISAQQHKHHVQEIMLSAPSEPMMGAPKGVFMRPLLGVLYDDDAGVWSVWLPLCVMRTHADSDAGSTGPINPKSLGQPSQ